MALDLADTAALTLVAFYGDKPAPLTRLFGGATAELTAALGEAFTPCASAQIHATVIGLEGHSRAGRLINNNYWQLRQQRRVMDIAAALQWLGDSDLLPMTITLGGYQPDQSYGFTSRGAVPFERSFSFQGGKAVAMGWPWQPGSDYQLALDALRRQFNAANILHKYHAANTAIDNDCFFVLGHIDQQLGTSQRQQARQRLQDYFAAQAPVQLTIAVENLRVVAYTDSRLPRAGSVVLTVEEALQRLAL